MADEAFVNDCLDYMKFPLILKKTANREFNVSFTLAREQPVEGIWITTTETISNQLEEITQKKHEKKKSWLA